MSDPLDLQPDALAGYLQVFDDTQATKVRKCFDFICFLYLTASQYAIGILNPVSS